MGERSEYHFPLTEHSIKFGVSQGSSLRPLLFVISTGCIWIIASASFHFYAKSADTEEYDSMTCEKHNVWLE